MLSIRIDGLHKRFGKTIAVQDLCLDIEEGEFVSVLGPSGCGKTTVLRCLAGLEIPNSGTIHMDGQLVFSSRQGIMVPPGRRGIGMVFQSYALWPHMSVGANVAFGLETQGVAKDELQRRVLEALEIVGIGELSERYPSELSGGQQQRVALARALVTEPRILLLDEPLSNLDAKLRLQMRSELQRLHLRLGCTVVYVTHDQLEASTLSTRIVLMREGILQQVGTPKEIYQKPTNAWVADFIGSPSINFLTGTITEDGDGIRLNEGSVLPVQRADLTPGMEVTVGIRPETVSIVARTEPSDLAGTIHSLQPAGNETFVQVRVGQEIVTVRVFGEVHWVLDEGVGLSIDQGTVLVFRSDTEQLVDEGDDCSSNR